MPKIKKRKKIIKKRLTTRGGIEIVILIVVVILGFIIGGGLFGQNRGNSPIGFDTTTTCCDTGDGNACQPQKTAGKTLMFNNQEYGLLRTNSVLTEGNLHLKDSHATFNGKPIILNSSDTHARDNPVANNGCNRRDPYNNPKDLYFKKTPTDPYMFMRSAQPADVIAQYCDSIPNDNLIFVCKQNCAPAACTWTGAEAEGITCYGSDKTVYDAYYKISAYDSSGIPEFIKNCDKSHGASSPGTASGQRIILPTDYPGFKNLQLRTFKVIREDIMIPWLSPLCKPAIYLYPTTTTDVNVKVAPVGKMSYTDPKYPSGGWNVKAQPNGILSYQNKSYDYLYYEAEIPDSNIEKPKKGFVVAKKDLPGFLTEILPKLSLNKKEAEEFKDYWIKALPDSPYYFLGIVSQSNLNSIAPLSISPAPNTVIRVTLYFEALENKISVTEPTIIPIKRNGFTVVEWGGIFKKDKNHPFSCFM